MIEVSGQNTVRSASDFASSHVAAGGLPALLPWPGFTNIDLTSSEDSPRRPIRQVLGAVAEFEKNVIVLKLRADRERKRARAERVERVKPYGHLPTEQAVIDRMLPLRRKPPKGRRLSVAAIAAQLNAEGTATEQDAGGHRKSCIMSSRRQPCAITLEPRSWRGGDRAARDPNRRRDACKRVGLDATDPLLAAGGKRL